MPKDAPGRNDPCPCGSGKKYKKCCLSEDLAKRPQVTQPHEHAGHAEHGDHDHVRAGVVQVPAGLSAHAAREYVQRLDRWSNAGHDAIDAGRLEEAEKLADRLQAEYPEQLDGYELRAYVRLQQQRWAEAAEGFEQALSIAIRHRKDYDEELLEDLRDEIDHARAHAEGRPKAAKSNPGAPHAHRHE